jgi:hypothetical protein
MEDKPSCKELLEKWKTDTDISVRLEEHKHSWFDQMTPCPIQRMACEKRMYREKLFKDDYMKTTQYFQNLLQTCFQKNQSISFKAIRFTLGYDHEYYTTQSSVRMHTLKFVPSTFVGFASHNNSSTKLHRIFYHCNLSNDDTPKICNYFYHYKIDYDGKVNLDTLDLKIMIEESSQMHDEGDVYDGYGFLISKSDIFNTQY